MRRTLLLAGSLAASALLSLYAHSLFAQGQGGAGGAQPDPWPNSRKLLAVADVQTGFHHDSISHALATVERIGRHSGAYMTMIRTDSRISCMRTR